VRLPAASTRTLAPLVALLLVACASAPEAAPSAPVNAEPPPSEAVPPSNEPPASGEPAPTVGGADCDARKAKIQASITEAGRCSTDADCTTMMPGCPFGCFPPIHRDTDVAAIEAEIEAYNQSCAACAYRCRPLEHPPTCSAGRCTTE